MAENIPAESENAWRRALLDAADYIERRGWSQFQSGRNDGPICMVSAIATVCVYSKPFARALEELKQALGADPMQWNDKPGRTQAEVIAALRGCHAEQLFWNCIK